MSTVKRPDPHVLPPLEPGQRLDQPTFHARYEAMPPQTRAELIGGVVYMPSPVSDDHGESSFDVVAWLGYYQRFTRGVSGAGPVSAILGRFSEPEPDCTLRIPETLGGLSRVNEHGYITGPPELVIEVARSSRKIDLGDKKKDYRRAGVPEYVVIELDAKQVHWFVLQNGRYVQHPADPEGIFRSTIFPGLWLNSRALFDRDLAALFATLDQGVATPEHAAFAAALRGA